MFSKLNLRTTRGTTVTVAAVYLGFSESTARNQVEKSHKICKLLTGAQCATERPASAVAVNAAASVKANTDACSVDSQLLYSLQLGISVKMLKGFKE
ncbi:jg14199 [Pararge aegeria aegeria]|uniref:Jg14199 protein n=1 Tax=Pararge aegeria aegeria TaxID=348720 RepID=A0A8S4QG26_9NEOP|nr:jg14199 [Pararge aegeria aegeria]